MYVCYVLTKQMKNMVTEAQVIPGAIFSNGNDAFQVIELDHTTVHGKPITFVISKIADDKFKETYCDSIGEFTGYMNEIGCKLVTNKA